MYNTHTHDIHLLHNENKPRNAYNMNTKKRHSITL